jgi:predicted deacetylase
LALHGWDHFLSQETEEYEFEDMKEAEAASKIRDGKKIKYFNIGELGHGMHGLGTPEYLEIYLKRT